MNIDTWFEFRGTRFSSNFRAHIWETATVSNFCAAWHQSVNPNTRSQNGTRHIISFFVEIEVGKHPILQFLFRNQNEDKYFLNERKSIAAVQFYRTEMWLNVIILIVIGLWNSFCHGCNSQKFGDFTDPKEALLTLASKASKQYGVTWVEKEPVINKNLSFASKLISFRLGNWKSPFLLSFKRSFLKIFWNISSNWTNQRRWCHILEETSKTQRKNSRNRNHLEHSSFIQDFWPNSSQKCQKCIDCNHMENRIFVFGWHSKSLPWNILLLRAFALFTKSSNGKKIGFFPWLPISFFFWFQGRGPNDPWTKFLPVDAFKLTRDLYRCDYSTEITNAYLRHAAIPGNQFLLKHNFRDELNIKLK